MYSPLALSSLGRGKRLASPLRFSGFLSTVSCTTSPCVLRSRTRNLTYCCEPKTENKSQHNQSPSHCTRLLSSCRIVSMLPLVELIGTIQVGECSLVMTLSDAERS